MYMVICCLCACLPAHNTLAGATGWRRMRRLDLLPWQYVKLDGEGEVCEGTEKLGFQAALLRTYGRLDLQYSPLPPVEHSGCSEASVALLCSGKPYSMLPHQVGHASAVQGHRKSSQYSIRDRCCHSPYLRNRMTLWLHAYLRHEIPFPSECKTKSTVLWCDIHGYIFLC